MLRGILGVVVGYIAIFAVVFVCLTSAYLALGVDRSFKPNSYDVSTVWAGIMIAVSVLAAFIGGVVCSIISRSVAAVRSLACLVFVLGGLSALNTLSAERPDPAPVRSGDVSNWKAMQNAQSPTWSLVVTPVIGAIGILIGAAVRPPTDHA